MILSLSIRRREGGRVVLGYAPAWRVLFALIAAGLAAGMAYTLEYPIILVAVAVVCAAVAMWEEGWEVDRDAGAFKRRRGFWPIVREERMPLSALRYLSLRVASGPSPSADPRNAGADTHIPEFLKKGRAVLVALVDEGSGPRTVLIDEGSHRERDRLEGLGRALAEASGAELRGAD
jgi:hypothetical protein